MYNNTTNNISPSSSIRIDDQDSTINRNSDIPIIEKEIPERKWINRQWIEIFYTPKGVRLRHYFIVTWLGKIGFIAKGIVYAVMGGLCIATAQHLNGDVTGTESPMVCTNTYKQCEQKKNNIL